MKIPRLIPAFLAVLCVAAAPQGASARELTTVVSQTTVTADPTATSQKASTPKGLTVKGNKISFYKNGSMVKDRWLNYKGTKYYFGTDGYAFKGTHRINNKVYVFDEKGRLIQNKQNKMVTVYDKKYYKLLYYLQELSH